MTSTPLLRSLPLVAALLSAAAPAHAAWPAEGLPLCVATGAQSGVRSVSDGADGAVTVWVDGRSGTADIYAQRVLTGGQAAWKANGVAVCQAAGAQITPGIADDGAGGAFIVWEDQRAGVGDPDVYIQHVSASGVPLWTTNGVRVCDAVSLQGDPGVVGDGAGGAFVAWVDQRNGVDSDVYAQHVSAGGAVQWGAGGIAVCDTSGDQTALSCAADGAGGVLVAWQDTRASDMVSDIYVQRIDGATGAPLWRPEGRVVSVASGLRQAYSPRIVADGTGGGLTAWEDYRSGLSADVYGSHVEAGGTIASGWDSTGNVVCDAAGNQASPVVVSDGAGGMVVAWEDTRGGSRDLYAQRMSGAGARQWTASGVAVCVATGNQAGLDAVADGSGGALLTWYDYRNGSETDIYAQKIVAAAGSVAPGWPADGVAVCTATADQQSPTLVACSNGSMLVAWQDYRNGNYDVYALAVLSSGGVADVAAPPLSLRVGESRPNPARGAAALELEIPAARRVTARVFDLSGRAVRTLEPGRTFEAGRHRLEWDGREDGGDPVAPGLYLVRIEADRETQVRRVVRLR